MTLVDGAAKRLKERATDSRLRVRLVGFDEERRRQFVERWSVGGALAIFDSPSAARETPDAMDLVILHSPREGDVRRWCASCSRNDGPVIVVLDDDEEAFMRAFRAGADDCLPTGAPLEALLERASVNAARARARRLASESPPRAIPTESGLMSISLTPTVALNGIPLDFPRIQARLLHCMLAANGRPVAGAELTRAAWQERHVSGHTLHTQIALLKARLEPLGLRIEHIRRRGYLLRQASD